MVCRGNKGLKMSELDSTHHHNYDHHHRWMSSPDQSSSSSTERIYGYELEEKSSTLRIMEGNTFVMSEMLNQSQNSNRLNDANTTKNLAANAISAAGAAFLSAVLVNPLDVAKTRLQAQAAGVQYAHPLSNTMSRMAFFGPNMMFADLRCSPTCTRAGIQGTVSICPPDCFQYKGTLDVLYKIVRQEGVTRLWRGTNAGLALAIPMVRIHMEEYAAKIAPSMGPYVPFVAGALARSLACTTCYPIELARTRMQDFKETGKKPPGVLKTLIGIVSNVSGTSNSQNK